MLTGLSERFYPRHGKAGAGSSGINYYLIQRVRARCPPLDHGAPPAFLADVRVAGAEPRDDPRDAAAQAAHDHLS